MTRLRVISFILGISSVVTAPASAAKAQAEDKGILETINGGFVLERLSMVFGSG
jgi:hypothetical protein